MNVKERYKINIIHILLYPLLYITLSTMVYGQSIEFSGQIINKSNQQPIIDAYVILKPINKVTYTNSDGMFSIKGLSAGRYILSVRHVSYEEYSEEIDINQSLSNKKIMLNAISYNSETLVVSSTQTLQKVGDIGSTSKVIIRKDIEDTGASTLNEVLDEVAGLNVVYSSMGDNVGLEIQGIDPEFVTILLDNEPLIGKSAGDFDISRIAAYDIERIEIINGASSALYGSEAFAGVINIITKKDYTSDMKWDAYIRYGRFDALNTYISTNMNFNNYYLTASLERVSRSGYNFNALFENEDSNTDTTAMSNQPYSAYTFRINNQFDLSDASRLNFGGRLFFQNSNDNYGVNVPIEDNSDETDVSFNLKYLHIFNNAISLNINNYLSYYSIESQNKTHGEITNTDDFSHTYIRSEWQLSSYLPQNNELTFGAGGRWEKVKSNRYIDAEPLLSGYVYVQNVWKPSDSFFFNVGSRFDYSTEFGSSFNPKFSMRWTPIKKLTVRSSVGKGFKPPDYRQIYTTFYNPLGYGIFGNDDAAKEELKQIYDQYPSAFLIPFEELESLKNQSAWSVNAGIDFNLSANMKFTLNYFNNSISNQIVAIPITRPFAIPRYPFGIFSYENQTNIISRGYELGMTTTLSPQINFRINYQFLDIYDRDDKLDAKEQGIENYDGLFSKAKHRATFKLNWDMQSNFGMSLTGIYVGKYGYSALDGSINRNTGQCSGPGNCNGILDQPEEYAPDNLRLDMNFYFNYKKIRMQLHIENLFDTKYQDIPALNRIGRMVSISTAYNF